MTNHELSMKLSELSKEVVFRNSVLEAWLQTNINPVGTNLYALSSWFHTVSLQLDFVSHLSNCNDLEKEEMVERVEEAMKLMRQSGADEREYVVYAILAGLEHEEGPSLEQTKVLKMAAKTLALLEHAKGCPKSIFNNQSPEEWGCTCGLESTIIAINEVLE